jgi:hypothetical protein
MRIRVTTGVPGPPGTPAPALRVRARATTAALRRRRALGERGAVTAETVMVLPLLAAVSLGLAWVLTLAGTQVRVVDAAREVARATARGEDRSAAVALGRRVAPRGALIEVEVQQGTVVVHVRSTVEGPHGLLSFVPGVHVVGEAVAAAEEQP